MTDVNWSIENLMGLADEIESLDPEALTLAGACRLAMLDAARHLKELQTDRDYWKKIYEFHVVQTLEVANPHE